MHALTDDEIAALKLADDSALRFRKDLPERDIPPLRRVDEMLKTFRRPLNEQPIPASQVIADLIADADPGLNAMPSGRFFGYVIGGSMPVGVAADHLVSAWGQNAGSNFETPAITGIENAVGDWALDLLGLPANSGVGIVTGATVANYQGIMAARHMLLKHEGWNVEEDGMFGAPAVPVLAGAAAHGAPLAGVRYAGFGSKNIIRVETDDQGRMRPDALAAELEKCPRPPLVILQAGQINTGACDLFEELIPLVRAKKGWVHVDGAFGLWLAAVPELRDRIKGVEHADSWAVDLHKWLSAPFDAALCIVADKAALIAAMSAWGAYLPQTSDLSEPSDTAIELSRRARGVPAYVIFKSLGKNGVRELILRHARFAERLVELLSNESGLKVMNDPVSNQVSLTCGEGEQGDEQTLAVLAEVQKRGKVYPSHGEWQGRAIIRCSICSYATDEDDISLLADEIIAAWRQVREAL